MEDSSEDSEQEDIPDVKRLKQNDWESSLMEKNAVKKLHKERRRYIAIHRKFHKLKTDSDAQFEQVRSLIELARAPPTLTASPLTLQQ